LFAGCISAEDGTHASKAPEVTRSPATPAITISSTPFPSPSPTPSATATVPTPSPTATVQQTEIVQKIDEKAGYKAYFAAVRFSDGTGHAIVSFKSTVTGFTSWYFFEPQTNNLLTPETLQQELGKNMGKQVTEVNIYGYFDDAGDKDPASWRFAYPLYNKKY
jgi:hypothetical protein